MTTTTSATHPIDESALLALGRFLRGEGYRFTTITPRSHGIVNARPGAGQASDLAGAFGWSRPFERGLLPDALGRTLEATGLLQPDGPRLRSTVRWSTLEGLLLAHSAYPTVDEDAVFFGPDTYRFARWIAEVLPALCLPRAEPLRVLDLGCGSGAGGLAVAAWASGPVALTLADINPRALQFARANAALAGVEARTVESDLFAALPWPFDLVLANPPYLVDPAGRTYRDGAGELGTGLALRMLEASLPRLAPGGCLALYTGAPVSAGRDVFLDAARGLLRQPGFGHRYAELDPDVFGEELRGAAYAAVDRIAAVGLHVWRAA